MIKISLRFNSAAKLSTNIFRVFGYGKIRDRRIVGGDCKQTVAFEVYRTD